MHSLLTKFVIDPHVKECVKRIHLIIFMQINLPPINMISEWKVLSSNSLYCPQFLIIIHMLGLAKNIRGLYLKGCIKRINLTISISYKLIDSNSRSLTLIP